ncbi:hypothetical protein M885DRAFT_530149 [Pelagophyceae sp. CCMP2097]|nr:hypothetical protein M885DRAFT_530149 [Pelagophyceae sp. CCMP2097]|mmetsp:Transcript_1017/g.3703  ORF Transcript_1017/g.3703 Transcript_1017/m.3703 type:complete len:278 (+) Transcript_1017:49-882(+)
MKAALLAAAAAAFLVGANAALHCDEHVDECRRHYRGPVPHKDVGACQIDVEQWVDAHVKALLQAKDKIHLLTHEGGGQVEQRLWMCSVLKRDILEQGVPGAIVELGVFKGATSTLIAHTNHAFSGGEPREHHLYDSFEGFPAPTAGDKIGGHAAHSAFKGNIRSAQTDVSDNFKRSAVAQPTGLHKGFFGNIPDEEYPNQIAFAFFDGDMYQSIKDSFAKVWHKLAIGGVVFIHDYQAESPETKWPGPKRALDEFFKDKPERVEQCWANIGKIVKQQ